MERKKPQLDNRKWQAIQKQATDGSSLARALATQVCYRFRDAGPSLPDVLTDLYGKPLAQVTAEEFLHPKLQAAFSTLAGKDIAEKLPALIALRLEGQFSSHPWRRSYRSAHFAFYFNSVLMLLCQLIRGSCYPESIRERLYCTEEPQTGYEYLLALEIRRGNTEIISLLHETMMGENNQILLTREIIDAIVISGHENLLEDLLKLLLAAKLQEGLRQQILEAADKGTAKVLYRFLKVCIDHNLLRFSGAIRAFDMWTGLGFGDAKPAAIQKYAALAYECLCDESARKQYFQSSNNIEAYFSLWAQGCMEYLETIPIVQQLLTDSRHYRQVLGWLFVTRSDSDRYQFQIASAHLAQRDEELLAWIICNLPVSWSLLARNWLISGDYAKQEISNSPLPKNQEDRRRLFFQLKEIALFIGNKKRVFQGNPFEFSTVTLENERVYNCMMSLALYGRDNELISEILALAPNMAVDQRLTIIRVFLRPESDPEHRAFLQKCLNDRSIMVKEAAVESLSHCKLTSQDLELLAEGLRSKSSDLRSGILTVLKKQSVDLLAPLLPRMLGAAQEYQIQAALELLSEFKSQYPQIFNENRPALQALRSRKLSTQTEILLNQLLPEDTQEVHFSLENGYGLYDPTVVDAYLSGLNESSRKPGLLSRILGNANNLLSAKQIKAWIPSWEELDALMARLDQVFTRHADEVIQVQWHDGSRTTVLFGNPGGQLLLPASCGCISLGSAGARLEMLPFWEEFREALGVYATDLRKMLGLFHLTAQVPHPFPLGIRDHYSLWYLSIQALNLAPSIHEQCRKEYSRWQKFLDIFHLLPQLFDPHEVFVAAFQFYRSMIGVIGEENLSRSVVQTSNQPAYLYPQSRFYQQAIALNSRMLLTWRKAIRCLKLSEENFADWFSLQYRLEQNAPVSILLGLTTDDYFRACHEGIIPKDVLLAYLADGQLAMPAKINILTNPNRWAEGRKIYESYPFAGELMSAFLDRIVSIEEKRGELPTDFTQHCMRVHRFEGAQHFCNLLAALGKENFFRGYEYSQNDTKRAVLSRLLKRCYPAKEDTPERLAVLLKATDISDKRLAEAVMYAPQWAGFAEKILGWPGLKCGVWFFHAHINETFSAEKETETAIYSPISPQQFFDGAFDKNWFFEAYDQLGETRFQILYKAAKYITSGSYQHRRSQLYSDAVLGKLNAQELMQEITEKRNQEKLRCYPLIPIADGDDQEALQRYEFIQKFLKESKQFGAQRRDSEKRACATAMENLAITTGLMDVNRLMWQMESQKIQEIMPLMEPILLEGVSVRLTIDENGDAGITMEKAGKVLKTPPKSIAKIEAFLERKATVKGLKDLKQRSRDSMERAMMECTLFVPEELQNICNNPVLAPMVRSLVWTDGENNGFLQQSADRLVLVKLDGTIIAADALRIAHPHDLKTAGDWAGFMQFLYREKTIQPFKQVFREYYPITEDERQERTLSRRYAGHQVQPQRTAALLKARGWTVDYEEGLQKVFYKENLIVRMYAIADWFSPADIEPPTLETVEFFDRTTKQNVPLEDIPPILFSETMRDLDLVVSVAHAGGVDPEASHSTVEMRTAIATELVKLLKLSNVSWLDSHAKIHGKLANYSVHMGSGVVHAEGVGMVSILPVHSQSRGRIFLPFADDDPKTAEIMSKVLLLAEDQKIKDPTILSQLSY